MSQPDPQAGDIGRQMHRLISELYPICRSITGNGVRETLRLMRRHLPLDIREVPSGTPVFDWIVPKEWNIKDAYIKNSKGERVIDFKKSNLHVVSYSEPIKKKLPVDELRKHIVSLPDHPDWIPYRTSYYNPSWGFCATHRQVASLTDDEYDVCIDSSLKDGSLTYGEFFLQGSTEDEVLISCHICHPSLCNDNLSGISLATFLAKSLSHYRKMRYSYRFLFIPGTIGSITWLALNEAVIPKIKHGLVVVCVGDGGKFSYKKSRRGDAEIDRVVLNVLKHTTNDHEVKEFYPYGYDERQYCSPGFNLSVGSLSRTSHGCYPEYHTSADNLQLVRPEFLEESLEKYLAVIDVLEHNKRYLNQNPKCEPQLGRRGLYRAIGAEGKRKLDEMAMLWVLNLSDGDNSLLDISERTNTPFDHIKGAAEALYQSGLLKECETNGAPKE